LLTRKASEFPWCLQGQSIEPLVARQSFFAIRRAYSRPRPITFGATTVLFQTWGASGQRPLLQRTNIRRIAGGDASAIRFGLRDARPKRPEATLAPIGVAWERAQRIAPENSTTRWDATSVPGRKLISRLRCCFAQCSTLHRWDRVITVACQRRLHFSCSGWPGENPNDAHAVASEIYSSRIVSCPFQRSSLSLRLPKSYPMTSPTAYLFIFGPGNRSRGSKKVPGAVFWICEIAFHHFDGRGNVGKCSAKLDKPGWAANHFRSSTPTCYAKWPVDRAGG